MHEEKTSVRLAQSQVMSVRFSGDELRMLSAEAARSGMTVGALVKRAALDAAGMHIYSKKPEVQFSFSGSGQAAIGTTPVATYQSGGSALNKVTFTNMVA